MWDKILTIKKCARSAYVSGETNSQRIRSFIINADIVEATQPIEHGFSRINLKNKRRKCGERWQLGAFDDCCSEGWPRKAKNKSSSIKMKSIHHWPRIVKGDRGTSVEKEEPAK